MPIIPSQHIKVKQRLQKHTDFLPMIITCEECNTRYVVPSKAVGDEGRRVRCTNCGNEWFQEPDLDLDLDEEDGDVDSFAEELSRLHDEEELEPIPESVKPLPDGSSVPALQREESQGKEKDSSTVAKIMGICAALLVFLLIIGTVFVLKKPLVKLWPNMAVVYDMAGMDIPVTGEKLLFKGLTARAEQEGSMVNIKITGSLINLETEEFGVPYVQISLIEENGNIADRWVVKDMADHISAEGELAFETVYPGADRTIKEVKIELVPFYTEMKRTEGADETHDEVSDHDASEHHSQAHEDNNNHTAPAHEDAHNNSNHH